MTDQIGVPPPFDSFRGLFPALRELTFLNSAGMTPLPDPCREAMRRFIEGMGTRAYLDMDDWIRTITLARAEAAELIGAMSEEIAFIRNTSEGVSLVASGLELGTGDEVIINDIEFPSNVYPWLNLKDQGVNIVVIKNENGRVTPESIKAAITPKTRVVAISSVQYISGYRAPLAQIAQICHENNALFFVDAIQSLGVIPMDVKGCGIDFMSSGGFKWLCGPVGTGIFYCDKSRLDDLRLTRAGWNTVKNAGDYTNIIFEPKQDAGRFEEGSPNIPGIYGLYESIKLLRSVGVDKIESRVLNLTDHLVENLKSMDFRILSPRGDGEKSGIVIFAPKDAEKVEPLDKKLADENILVIRRGKGIRVAPHGFNNREDIDKLLDACGENK